MFYASYRWSTIHVNGIDFTRNWGTGEEEEQSPEAKEDTESLRNDPFAGDTISLNGGGGTLSEIWMLQPERKENSTLRNLFA